MQAMFALRMQGGVDDFLIRISLIAEEKKRKIMVSLQDPQVTTLLASPLFGSFWRHMFKTCVRQKATYS